jgi:type IV secretory pathway VirB3-like protein
MRNGFAFFIFIALGLFLILFTGGLFLILLLILVPLYFVAKLFGKEPVIFRTNMGKFQGKNGNFGSYPNGNRAVQSIETMKPAEKVEEES